MVDSSVIGRFISEIRHRRALWDIRHPTYHDKYKLYCGWREVSETFNISVPTAKQKWKNLRDTFRVEVKKEIKRATEPLSEGVEREPYVSTWQHYEGMLFLKDLLKTRRDVVDQEKMFEKFQRDMSYASGESSTDNVVDGAMEHDVKIECSDIIPSLNELGSFPADQEDGDASFDRGAFEAFAEEEQNKKRKMQEEHNNSNGMAEHDDDLFFFRSLVPYVKRLPDDKRLIFRTSVQQMLYNELYGESE